MVTKVRTSCNKKNHRMLTHTAGQDTVQHSTTLWPSVNTTAQGMFCGAKYTHHTFTPIIKHHYNSKQTSRSRCNKSHHRMLTHTAGRDVTKSHRMSTHTAGQNGNQTHSAAKDKPTDLGVVARAHRSWEWWPLSVARVGPLGPCPYPSHPAPSSPLVPSAPSSHQTETQNINVPGG